MQSTSILINYVYWPAFGHGIEALRYAYGYHLANPEKRISILLNKYTPVSVAELCPWIDRIYTVGIASDKAFVSSKLYSGIPTQWDYIISDPRGDSTDKYSAPGAFGRHFTYIRKNFIPNKGRGVMGDSTLPYKPNSHLYITLPAISVEKALDRLLDTQIKIAVLLTGGSYPRSFWPSLESWSKILTKLADQHTNVSFYFIGKSAKKGVQTPTHLAKKELQTLLERFSQSVNCFDIDLLEQLAIVKACDLLISPHSGFGFAASMVKTPWLIISGGNWPEYFFNGTPFYSVLPDPGAYPCYDDAFSKPVRDDDGTKRIPSMRHQRILDDAEEIVAASQSLINGDRSYNQALGDHFSKMKRFYSGSQRIQWFDNTHERFV